jgi:hypothetical protein
LQTVLHRLAGPHLAKVTGWANVTLFLGRETRAVAHCPGRAEGSSCGAARTVRADGTRQWRVRGAGADLARGARAVAIWIELLPDVFVRAEMPLSARKRVVLDVRTESHRAHLVRVRVGFRVRVRLRVGFRVRVRLRV